MQRQGKAGWGRQGRGAQKANAWAKPGGVGVSASAHRLGGGGGTDLHEWVEGQPGRGQDFCGGPADSQLGHPGSVALETTLQPEF